MASMILNAEHPDVVSHELGYCDQELVHIHIINENSMFKHQARYLVRKSFGYWSSCYLNGFVM
jgi:hypothetical protein